MIISKKAISLLCLAACLLSACEPQSTIDKSSAQTCLTNNPGTVTIPGGQATIGSNNAYREEAPVRNLTIDSFDIDATEVTNAQFQEFVNATDYVTDAEKKQAGFDVPGGAVFTPPTATNPSWWRFTEGANWKHPEGPESSIMGRGSDPVVQVSLRDAKAYAEWKGRRLPTDVEWEFAANGGSKSVFVWGDTKAPGGKEKANTWQGAFPVQNTKIDGFERRAPVGCFEANGYGLYDMIGNVWEWTDTPYPSQSNVPQYTIKGGSFLCAPNYCRRYRASALQPQDADFTTNHIGFRTVNNG